MPMMQQTLLNLQGGAFVMKYPKDPAQNIKFCCLHSVSGNKQHLPSLLSICALALILPLEFDSMTSSLSAPQHGYGYGSSNYCSNSS